MISRIILVIALVFAAVPDAAHVKKVRDWRTKHEADYRRDWVSIAGLHFLKPGVNTAGKRKDQRYRRLTTRAADHRPVHPQRPACPLRAGARCEGDAERSAGRIGDRDERRRPSGRGDELVINNVRMVIHVSGDRLSLRVRDSGGELARGFLGFKWFPVDETYRVVGRFIKDGEPRRMQVVNTLGDIDTYTTEGVIELTLLGKKMTVRPFTTRPKRFYIVFRDESSGKETYETARFL
jgi:uncharacterized protein (DUF1684 family)